MVSWINAASDFSKMRCRTHSRRRNKLPTTRFAPIVEAAAARAALSSVQIIRFVSCIAKARHSVSPFPSRCFSRSSKNASAGISESSSRWTWFPSKAALNSTILPKHSSTTSGPTQKCVPWRRRTFMKTSPFDKLIIEEASKISSLNVSGTPTASCLP